MKTLTVKMPPDLSDWLEKRACELNRPKSEIVREALDSQRRCHNSQSALARAGDLVGKYAGSRQSSHKRNLKQLGSWKHSSPTRGR